LYKGNNMEELSKKKCEPCEKGTPPLTREELQPLMQQISGWELIDDKTIEKSYSFKDFAMALAFVNRVGEVAEKEGHHPDIYLGWGKVKISLMTHKIKGLTKSDFILAAKCDTLVGL